MKSDRIKDTATRDAVRDLELLAERMTKIPQLPNTATMAQIIAAINKLTNSLKR